MCQRRTHLFAAIVSMLLVSSGCATTDVAPLRLRGVWVAVHVGDTLDVLCRQYGADPAAVAELNNIASPDELKNRGEVFVPTAHGSPPGDGLLPRKPKEVSVARGETPRSAATGTCVGESCLSWPLAGEVMAVFDVRGKAPHDGLDIKAPEGTPVRAAASGKVLYSGDGIKGYGNMVIIKHEQGLVTVYAHAARNLVKEGDNVERGALVVEVGRTGSAREAHLHFEVRKQEEPVNPLSYLPTRSEDGRENK